MEIRASICALTDNAGEIDEAERWLDTCKERLTFVSEMYGCGCCVHLWDVQGPDEIIKTLPAHLLAGGEWASSRP